MVRCLRREPSYDQPRCKPQPVPSSRSRTRTRVSLAPAARVEAGETRGQSAARARARGRPLSALRQAARSLTLVAQISTERRRSKRRTPGRPSLRQRPRKRSKLQRRRRLKQSVAHKSLRRQRPPRPRRKRTQSTSSGSRQTALNTVARSSFRTLTTFALTLSTGSAIVVRASLASRCSWVAARTTRQSSASQSYLTAPSSPSWRRQTGCISTCTDSRAVEDCLPTENSDDVRYPGGGTRF
mmetsp:Transcript_18622/g.59416  ORF Transcript_18622/g.59416 Transcript_18622/m.59416 type:complete len:241 (-) Transcript_18622:179-901(-)